MLRTSVMEFDVMNCLDDAAEHGPRYSDGIMNETGLWGWRCPICVADLRKIQCRALKSSTGNQTYHVHVDAVLKNYVQTRLSLEKTSFPFFLMLMQ